MLAKGISFMDVSIDVYFGRLVHMPPGIQNRDLVQYVAEKRDESTNTTYIVYHNAPGKVEPKNGVVRYAMASNSKRK